MGGGEERNESQGNALFGVVDQRDELLLDHFLGLLEVFLFLFDVLALLLLLLLLELQPNHQPLKVLALLLVVDTFEHHRS
jgi:hypothetical protein